MDNGKKVRFWEDRCVDLDCTLGEIVRNHYPGEKETLK